MKVKRMGLGEDRRERRIRAGCTEKAGETESSHPLIEIRAAWQESSLPEFRNRGGATRGRDKGKRAFIDIQIVVPRRVQLYLFAFVKPNGLLHSVGTCGIADLAECPGGSNTGLFILVVPQNAHQRNSGGPQ